MECVLEFASLHGFAFVFVALVIIGGIITGLEDADNARRSRQREATRKQSEFDFRYSDGPDGENH